VSTLSGAVSDISDLVDQQVTGRAGSATASPTLTTSTGTYAAITFSVPSGFTRAHVVAVSTLYAGGTVASVMRTRIDGDDGPEMFAFTNAAYASAASAHARQMTGLGASFQVSTRAHTSTGSTSAVIITAALATFLR